MTICGPIPYYPGQTRRRRLLDAHGRIAACWSDSDQSRSVCRTRSLLTNADLLDDGTLLPITLQSAASLIIKFSENVGPIPMNDAMGIETTDLIQRIDTIILPETPPPPDVSSPFRGIRFYLCNDLTPSQRSSFESWIALQGACLAQQCCPGSVDFIVGDDVPAASSSVTVRSSLWLTALQRFSDSFALSRGDVRNQGIQTIIYVFQELVQDLVHLGQHFAAHAYAQIMVAVMQYYEDSASDDSALDDGEFLDSALQSSADLAAAARELLSRRSPAAVLHQLRSDPKLVAITALTQKIAINTSLARRLLRHHAVKGFQDFQILSQRQRDVLALEPQLISAYDAERLLEHLQRCLPPDCLIMGCGAYRRRCEKIRALPIIVSNEGNDLCLNDVERCFTVKVVISRSQTQCDIFLDNDIRIQIRVIPWTWRYVAVLVNTGSDEFVRRFRWRARDLGYVITNDYRLLRAASHTSSTTSVDSRFESERDIFSLIGIDYVAPRWRLAFPLKATHSVLPEPIMRPATGSLIWRSKRRRRATVYGST